MSILKPIAGKLMGMVNADAIGVAMPGPRLPQRVRTIVEGGARSRVSLAGMAEVIAPCVLICVVCVAVTLTRAQSPEPDWEKSAGGKMSFEVASVKQDTADPDERNTFSNVGLDSQGFFTPTGGLFAAGNHPLTAYIVFAYKLTRGQVRDLTSRLPKWASTERWDINARATGDPTKDQYRLMMQSLLVDRFKIALHFETRQAPVLALALQNSEKLGPRLQHHPVDVACVTTTPSGGWPVPTVSGGFPKPCGSVMWGPAPVPGEFYMGARDVPIAMIANALSFQPAAAIDRTVVDETGLTGNFDFTLQFSPPVAMETRSGEIYQPDEEGSTFVGALKQQLGLRLISTTGPVSEIVVDHVDEPTAN